MKVRNILLGYCLAVAISYVKIKRILANMTRSRQYIGGVGLLVTVKCQTQIFYFLSSSMIGYVDIDMGSRWD